jgi:hypothetical protein
MSSIQHIAELFNFDERDFITAAYRTLLGREPDPIGMNYYLGRLRMGYGKAAVIVQLATSAEANPPSQISGLVNLIKEEQRASHWLWGFLSRHHRAERLMRQHIDELKNLANHIAQLPANMAKTDITHAVFEKSHQNSPEIRPAEPEGLNELTPGAQRIYNQLKKAISRQTGSAN